LALAPRPRGEGWIDDEISSWRRSGINTVVSLLTSSEEQDLKLTRESEAAKSHGMGFISFPIEDRKTPTSEQNVAQLVEKMDAKLSQGQNLVVHCRQGVGRSGLIAACLLVTRGWSPQDATQKLTEVRGVPIPETTEQRDWIDHFAVLANFK
jgi:protein-tyrosine phosphatase